MNPCEYCGNEATTKRRVYSADFGAIDVIVCESCATYIDDNEPYDEPTQYE